MSKRIQKDQTSRKQMFELMSKYKILSGEGTKSSNKQHQLFEIINCIGMKFTKEGYLQHGQHWLQKSKKLVQNKPKLQIILLNNLACICKKQNRYNQALKYMKQSQTIIIELKNKYYRQVLYSECLLNICAIQSALGNHIAALEAIQKSLELLSNKINSQAKLKETYLIAKFNEAIQWEHLGCYDKSYQSYEAAKQFIKAQKMFGHYLQNKIYEISGIVRKKMLSKRSTSMFKSIDSSRKNEIRMSHKVLLKSHLYSHHQSINRYQSTKPKRYKESGQNQDFGQNQQQKHEIQTKSGKKSNFIKMIQKQNVAWSARDKKVNLKIKIDKNRQICKSTKAKQRKIMVELDIQA